MPSAGKPVGRERKVLRKGRKVILRGLCVSSLCGLGGKNYNSRKLRNVLSKGCKVNFDGF